MDRFEELTAKYLDDASLQEETRELAEHVRANPASAQQFLTFHRQDRLLVELHRSDEEAIESIMAAIRTQEGAFVGSVMQQVRADLPRRTRSRLWGDWPWLRGLWRSGLVWAGAMAAVFICVYFLVRQPVVGEPVLVLAQGNTVAIERAGQSAAGLDGLKLQPEDVLTLSGTNLVAIAYGPEATRLELHPGTTLKLLAWNRGKRLEMRQGRVVATVARQRLMRPMQVTTPNSEVRVLGTRFTLTVTTNRTRLDVAEGRVRLMRLGDRATVKVAADQYAILADAVELAALPATGRVIREYWTNYTGNFAAAIALPVYSDHPDGREFLSRFQLSSGVGRRIGERVRAYLHPPKTGEYAFSIAGEEASLWFSPDEHLENRVQVAYFNDTIPLNWVESRSRQSSGITLVAGRKYYLEAIHESRSGKSQLSVAWHGPGREREIIPGEFLSPFEPNQRSVKR